MPIGQAVQKFEKFIYTSSSIIEKGSKELKTLVSGENSFCENRSGITYGL